jgi:hypothetical protein
MRYAEHRLPRDFFNDLVPDVHKLSPNQIIQPTRYARSYGWLRHEASEASVAKVGERL